MANLDILQGARMLALLTPSEEQAHDSEVHRVRGEQATIDQFLKWASLCWLELVVIWSSCVGTS